MSDVATSTRRPNARAEKARETRRRMREAALALFREQGYAATPMQAIADRAGVAVQTLYFTFGTKRALLSEILDVAIAGDEEPVATLDRPHIQALLDDPDPVVQLRGQAAVTRRVYERLAPALEVVRGAATADPDLAALWERSIQQRATVMERFIAALATKTTLRDGMDQATAVDIALTLQSPEVITFLTAQRGWSPDKYEQWLASALTTELLGPGRCPVAAGSSSARRFRRDLPGWASSVTVHPSGWPCLPRRNEEHGGQGGGDGYGRRDGEGVREAADGAVGDAGRGDGGQDGDADAAADLVEGVDDGGRQPGLVFGHVGQRGGGGGDEDGTDPSGADDQPGSRISHGLAVPLSRVSSADPIAARASAQAATLRVPSTPDEMAAQVCADAGGDRHGQEQQPGAQRAPAADVLQVDRAQEEEREQQPGPGQHQERAGEHRAAGEHPHVQQRGSGSPLGKRRIPRTARAAAASSDAASPPTPSRSRRP